VLGLDMFLGTYLNKFVFLGWTVIDNSIYVVHQVRCSFCLKTGTDPASEMLCCSKKLEDGESPKQ